MLIQPMLAPGQAPGNGLLQNPVVFPQMFAVTDGMVEMIGQGVELHILAAKARVKQPDRKFRVLPSPADKVLVKTIDQNGVLAPEGKVAGFDPPNTCTFK
jgi:hypothetical protein